MAESATYYANAFVTRSLLAIRHCRTALGHDQVNAVQRWCNVLRAVPNLKPVSALSHCGFAFDLAVLEDPYRWYA